MITELRATMNIRISTEANVSFVFVNLVDTQDEAEDAGGRANHMIAAWLRGYTKAEPMVDRGLT